MKRNQNRLKEKENHKFSFLIETFNYISRSKLKNKTMKKIITLLSAFFITLNVFSQCNDSLSSPFFPNFDPVITVSCEDYENILVYPYDSCDAELDILWAQDTILGNCPREVTYVRTWRVFDDYGNALIEQQIIHVVDNTPPVISGVPDDITLSCGDPVFSYPTTPMITDNCSSVITTNFSSYVDCTDSTTSLIFSWDATDECGNSSYDEFVVNILNPNIICDEEEDEEDEDDNQNLIAMCHNTGNGCFTIYVSPQAVQAHVNHGDNIGPCNGPCIPERPVNERKVRNLVPGTDFDINTIDQGGENKTYIHIRNN